MTMSQLMKMAHTLRSAFRCGMSESLRMAWAYKRGSSHAYSILLVSGGRAIGFGHSYDEVRKARIAEEHALIAKGKKPLGSYETNMEPYAPAIEAVSIAMKLAA